MPWSIQQPPSIRRNANRIILAGVKTLVLCSVSVGSGFGFRWRGFHREVIDDKCPLWMVANFGAFNPSCVDPRLFELVDCLGTFASSNSLRFHDVACFGEYPIARCSVFLVRNFSKRFGDYGKRRSHAGE